LGGASLLAIPVTKIGWTGAVCSLAALSAYLLDRRRRHAEHRVHSPR